MSSSARWHGRTISLSTASLVGSSYKELTSSYLPGFTPVLSWMCFHIPVSFPAPFPYLSEEYYWERIGHQTLFRASEELRGGGPWPWPPSPGARRNREYTLESSFWCAWDACLPGDPNGDQCVGNEQLLFGCPRPPWGAAERTCTGCSAVAGEELAHGVLAALHPWGGFWPPGLVAPTGGPWVWPPQFCLTSC